MSPDQLPDWAKQKIEEYFDVYGMSYAEGLYSVLHFWCTDVGKYYYRDIVYTPTVFAAVKRTNGSIYFLQVTQDALEVINVYDEGLYYEDI